MALVKFYKTTSEKLAAHTDLEEGAIYLNTDNDKMYIDLDGTRRVVGDIDTSSFVTQNDFLSNEEFIAAMNGNV